MLAAILAKIIQILGQWQLDRFFALINFCTGHHDRITDSKCLMFELETKKWTEIRVNIPRIESDFLVFCVQSNTLLCMRNKITRVGHNNFAYMDIKVYRQIML
jgi:hypothetical protein